MNRRIPSLFLFMSIVLSMRVFGSEFELKERPEHMPEIEQCSLCHQGKNGNKLSLMDGTALAGDASPSLCGQCHGLVFRDWTRGIHGKQKGSFDKSGENSRPGKEQLKCTACHDPHSPRFKKMKAEPAPEFPRFGIPKHMDPHNEEETR